MKILALELSSSRGSIAFQDAKADKFFAEFVNDRKHSGAFFEQLQRCVTTCGVADEIVVGLGPGSYAGTRIAIATATGLAAASGAQLAGLPSIGALPDEIDYITIGDARRQTFFFARISNRCCIEGPELCSETELDERLRNIDLPVFTVEPLPRFPRARVAYPSAKILAQLVADQEAMMQGPLEPIYLREPHITQPKHARS